MNLKDKKLPLIAGGAAVVVILLLLIFMPSDKSGDQGPEVISKRVKIELQDTATDISASAESTVDNAAPEGAPAMVAQPSTTPVPEAKPAPAQAKIEPKAAESKPSAIALPAVPAPRRVEQAVKAPVEKTLDAPKAVKTVKTATKSVEKTKKAAASKRIAAGNAWALNIASFPSLSEAQSLAGKLKKGGYNAYIAGFTRDSFKWHRVRVGFFASRDEASKAAAAIQSKFRVDKPWIAKPDAAELKAHL
ncbi:MAG: SPOR domain-containing protein [Deltaproteobacteria bacterium]|nr:SPOR domain-containing protein [Deltaproteobacteria bacterium]